MSDPATQEDKDHWAEDDDTEIHTEPDEDEGAVDTFEDGERDLRERRVEVLAQGSWAGAYDAGEANAGSGKQERRLDEE